MTIFLDTVKAAITKKITEVRDKSVAADKSFANSFATLAGRGRDPKLAKSKRDKGDELLGFLYGFTDQKTDADTYVAMKKLVSHSKSAAKALSDDNDCSEGIFGTGMLEASQLLDSVYEKFQLNKLLDVSHDDDPFNIFRYHMATYLVQKLYDGPSAANFKITSRKEKLVTHALMKCASDLETLDKQHEQYQFTRKKRVLECMRLLSHDNAELCKEFGMNLSGGISLSFFTAIKIQAPSLTPEVGFLESCLGAAMNEIQPRASVEEAKPEGLVLDF